jgi:hypothetical protein
MDPRSSLKFRKSPCVVVGAKEMSEAAAGTAHRIKKTRVIFFILSSFHEIRFIVENHFSGFKGKACGASSPDQARIPPFHDLPGNGLLLLPPAIQSLPFLPACKEVLGCGIIRHCF